MGRPAVVVGAISGPLPEILLPVAVLLFPDGGLPSRRWRRALEALIFFSALFLVSQISQALDAVVGQPVRVDGGGSLLALDQSPHVLWEAAVHGVGVIAEPLAWLMAVGRQVAAWRRADGVRRQQLKWLMSGAVLAGMALVAITIADTLPGAADSDAIQAVDDVLGILILALAVALYAGLVLLATGVLRFHSTVAVAASTLAAAALFNPLRRRVQRRVDQRFNRARYDADRTVSAFAARLKDTVDLDSVRADLADVVHQALEPDHVSVWISRPG